MNHPISNPASSPSNQINTTLPPGHWASHCWGQSENRCPPYLCHPYPVYPGLWAPGHSIPVDPGLWAPQHSIQGRFWLPDSITSFWWLILLGAALSQCPMRQNPSHYKMLTNSCNYGILHLKWKVKWLCRYTFYTIANLNQIMAVLGYRQRMEYIYKTNMWIFMSMRLSRIILPNTDRWLCYGYHDHRCYSILFYSILSWHLSCVHSR